MVKIRNFDDQVKKADEFIKQMADKAYGVANERQERITISLDGELFDKIDNIVRKRKRDKKENRTISAYIREVLINHFNSMNS